jgi:signal transduction histidine kinase
MDLKYDPELSCYPTKLNQVFMNILINSCQAINGLQEDNITLRGEIEIITEDQDGMLNICFKDNGCGMKEDVLEKIFDPFFTTKEIGVGTGLGMAISFKIIEEHLGAIHVESDVNIGTEMSIALPI